MNITCQQASTSLDISLAILSQGLEKLKAAQPVDMQEVTEQLSLAAEAARGLRSLVVSVLPDATWQSREDLDALLAKANGVLDARARLLALVAELERGIIVHRRVIRINYLNQLRRQAIDELRAVVEQGTAPATLPGPGANQWIKWACGLKEPEDEVALQTLRNDFACLDNLVANLEPDMWVVEAEATV
jgi:hypothetical protein